MFRHPPFPVFGSSVHISFTPSNTMLQCRSKAFTLPNSFLLFLKHFISKTAASHCVYLQLIKTWVLFLTESVRTLRGPVENSSCCNIAITCDHCGMLIIVVIFTFQFLYHPVLHYNSFTSPVPSPHALRVSCLPYWPF